MRFVDTDVLLYSISEDPEERGKATRARTMLEDRSLVLSVQVLAEFYFQATRASRPDKLSHEQAAGLVKSFMRWSIQESNKQLVLAALGAMERFGLSYWDAAIIEAARLSGCRTVVSEALKDGEDYDGVRVENPFKGVRNA